MEWLTPWQRAVAAVALIKVIAGVAAFVTAFFVDATRLTPRDPLMMAHVAAFGVAAFFLVAGTGRDRRAVLLGISFLITASSFAKNGLYPFTRESLPVPALIRLIILAPADAFSPWFIWLFVQEFPRVAPFGLRHTLPRAIGRVAFASGLALFTLDVAHQIAREIPSLAAVAGGLGFMASRNTTGMYWLVVYALSLPGLGALLWKARAAPLDERRRVALLMTGIVVGSAPTSLWILLASLVPGFGQAFPLRVAGWILYPTLLSTPFATAYAVLVQQALDVRLVVRRAMQYALARYSVLILAAIPLTIILATLYLDRDRSIADLMTGMTGVMLALLAGLAWLASRGSRGVLDNLDRRFFRENYDSRQILRGLVASCQHVSGRDDLANILRQEIGRALHPVSMSVMFVDPSSGTISSPQREIRPLNLSDPIAALVAQAETPLDVDLERDVNLSQSLPVRDRNWLVDSGVRLLLPLVDASRRLVGLMALGDKRSELPYSAEDRDLLSTVSSAASLALAYLSVHPKSRTDREAIAAAIENAATECPSCAAVSEAGQAACGSCGQPTRQASLPRLVAGKFRIVERLGAGGMGVVYKGIDQELERPVAVKTLPRMSPDEAVRLRREARAMAAVSHPNLALIYGAESWNGMPMLIVEYLPGGTLDRRLKSGGPMSLTDALDLGITLADALASLHRAGILHRDVKPSNIGFSSTGVLKLLDFGLARLVDAPQVTLPDALTTAERRAEILRSHASLESLRVTTTADGIVVGTPLYLSPEAVMGTPPEPSFDIWAACIVVYEVMSGRNPAQDVNPLMTLRRIAECELADLRDVVPGAPPRLAEFFKRAFSANQSDRPRSAEALRAQLKAERAALGQGAPVAA